MRSYNNPLAINELILQSRLRSLDPSAKAATYRRPTNDGGNAGDQCVLVDSVLMDAQIESILVIPQTLDEDTTLQDYQVSVSDYEALNGYWNDTADQAVVRVTNAIFGGKTLAQVDTDIDALPATVAGMRTGLHSAAAQIIAIRTILTFIARAIIFLRNYAIRLRR